MATRVVSWDWAEQPDWVVIGDLLAELTGGRVYLRMANTGSDQYGLVVSTSPINQQHADLAYEAWRKDARDA